MRLGEFIVRGASGELFIGVMKRDGEQELRPPTDAELDEIERLWPGMVAGCQELARIAKKEKSKR